MANWAFRFWVDQSGQDLIEYTLVLTIFALMTIALVSGEMPSVKVMWNLMQGHLTKGSNVASAGGS